MLRKLLLTLPFFIFLSIAYAQPSSKISTISGIEGNFTINIYTDYYYPPEFFVVKVDGMEIDRFPSTETFHSYQVYFEVGEHWVEVWWDGPTWYGLSSKQKIVIYENYSKRIEDG